jgi:ABC-type antimicrobial peptide transport system permease subunit
MYVPYLQNNNIYVSVVARAEGDVASIRDSIKRAVQSIDPALAPDEVLPFRQLVEETLGSQKLQVTLLGGFGLIALLLAAVGIFAVTSYAVSQRMPEVGIRMAFGASPRVVVRELVAAAGKSVVAGVLLGAGLTIGVIRGAPLVSTYSASVDVRYATAVITILVASAIVASVIPAWRARQARPADLLRSA